jgi:hypothetical protein
VGGELNVFDDNGFIVKEKIKPPNWPRHTSARHRRRHISRRSSPTPAEPSTLEDVGNHSFLQLNSID